jgi:hypothetical protein
MRNARGTKLNSENLNGADHLRDLDVDRTVILKHTKKADCDDVNWIYSGPA